MFLGLWYFCIFFHAVFCFFKNLFIHFLNMTWPSIKFDLPAIVWGLNIDKAAFHEISNLRNLWQIVFAPIGGQQNFFQRPAAKHLSSTSAWYCIGGCLYNMYCTLCFVFVVFIVLLYYCIVFIVLLQMLHCVWYGMLLTIFVIYWRISVKFYRTVKTDQSEASHWTWLFFLYFYRFNKLQISTDNVYAHCGGGCKKL